MIVLHHKIEEEVVWSICPTFCKKGSLERNLGIGVERVLSATINVFVIENPIAVERRWVFCSFEKVVTECITEEEVHVLLGLIRFWEHNPFDIP